jgi:hypothetical protein
MFYRGMTKGEVLKYALVYALRRSRKIVRGLKEGLTEGERFAVADHMVAQLKERGEMAPELTGHGLPLSKCEAYNRVYDQPSESY